MKRQQLTAFYLEALVLVVIFVVMILVLTGVFGTARAQSAQAQRLTQAVTLAANAAEAVSAADDFEQAAALLDEGGNVHITKDQITALYNSDGTPCPDENGALRLTVTWEPSEEDAAFVVSRISVYAAQEDIPAYTMETARYRKEADA